MRFSAFLILAVLLAARCASAQPILVELFSSQNCAACPSAHETLGQVHTQRDDVLVLTWSVDYWDYLGEPDPMAMDMSTERQAAYADRFGLKGPYTPQSVYNGAGQCPGNRPSQVARHLAAAQAAAETQRQEGAAIGRIAFEDTPGGVSISVPAGLASDVHLVEFQRDGDNGTALVHPVTGFQTLTQLPFGGAVSATPACASGCVVLVQAPGHGAVYAAHRVN
ncbi:MAG: DUF1223 domain-containing protein [Pseudomonadota bacterium]